MKSALLAVVTAVLLGAGLFTAATVTPTPPATQHVAASAAATRSVPVLPAVTAAPVLTTTTARPPSTTTVRSTTTKNKPKPSRKTTTTRPPHVVGSGYDPTDPRYQGADDPGLAAGRAPNSADLQTQWGCQQGYIPKSQC